MKLPALTFGHCLPDSIAKRLFGDRKTFGRKADVEDPEWKEWNSAYHSFYAYSKGYNSRVNDSGYKIMNHVDLHGKSVLEVGPGELRHSKFWRGIPKRYTFLDIDELFLQRTTDILTKLGISANPLLLRDRFAVETPLPSNSFDVVISFYSLEHIYHLDSYIQEIKRILKQGGLVIGALPCEGGLAWGLGRYFTTRRWLKKSTRINPDKLICWEHPNFAHEVIAKLSQEFECQHFNYWPLKIPFIDFNLTVSFIFSSKRDR